MDASDIEIKNTTMVIAMLTAALFFGGCTSSIENVDSSFDAAINKDNDRAEYELRGEVKSMHEISYEAVKQGGKIIKGERKFNDLTDKVGFIIQFNQDGNTIQNNEYEWDGRLIWKETYKYDSNGNVIEESWDDIERNESRTTKIIYKLDNRQNKIEEMQYEPDGTLYKRFKFEYDDLGNRIEKIQYDPEAEVVQRHTYKYKKGGVMIEEKRYGSDDGDLRYTILYDEQGSRIEEKSVKRDGKVSRSVFKNDEMGNRIEDKWYDTDGSVSRDAYHVYDKRGNKIKEKSYNHKLKMYEDFEYIYKYDKKGNWIRRIDMIYGEPRNVVERKIEYY